MDFQLTDEQSLLQEGVSRYVADHYGFDTRRAIADRDPAFDETQWRRFAELGWLALTIPETAGGLGLTPLESALVTEPLGSALVLEPYTATAVLAARILAESDARERDAHLGAIAEGRLRIAVAHAEPGARYDIARVTTRAARRANGYRLSGEKQLVLHAPTAQQLIVPAVLEGAPGCGLFLVAGDAPGVERRDYRLLDATPAADVVLRGVALDGAALIVGPERGAAVLEEAIDRLLLAEVAYALGAMERVLEISAEYVKSRVQFGQPLFEFQATQHRLAEMFIEVQEVRSILYCGLAHIEAAPHERRRMVSAAKAVAAQAGRLVGGLGIQLHGGIGMTEEYRVGHYFKHLVVFEKLYGDVDHHLARLMNAGATAPAAGDSP